MNRRLTAYSFKLGPRQVVCIIRHEEQLLRLHFGTDYDDYCRKVRRWL